MKIRGKNYNETVKNITKIALDAIENNDFETINKLSDETHRIFLTGVYGDDFIFVNEWVYFVYEYLNSKINGVKNTGYELGWILYYYEKEFGDIVFIDDEKSHSEFSKKYRKIIDERDKNNNGTDRGCYTGPGSK